MSNIHDPLAPTQHDSNPFPPVGTTDFTLILPDGHFETITLAALSALPVISVPDCFIVSTGHGTTGPFTFTGSRLLDLINQYLPPETLAASWSEVAVMSGDGYGNRVHAHELHLPDLAGPILLAYEVDGQPLTRDQGGVRLIVPPEKRDALRQVKWVSSIQVIAHLTTTR